MLCTLAFSLLTSASAEWYEPRRDAMMDVCNEVLEHSETYNPSTGPDVDFQALVVAMSWRESRWQHSVEGSAGERGAMQVIPGYHCDNVSDCDYEAAGVRAISLALSDSRAESVRHALCRYNTGSFYSDCAYARRVLSTYWQIESAMNEIAQIEETFTSTR